MYKGIQSKVVANGTYSEWFECTVGVRQGENFSPFLFSLYLNQSKVVANGTYSEWFECTVGVRQGENFSPFLFSLYLNDLEEFLLSNNVKGLSCLSERVEREYLSTTFCFTLCR